MRFRNATFLPKAHQKLRVHTIVFAASSTKTLEYARKRYNSHLRMRQIDAPVMFAMWMTSAFSKASVFAVHTKYDRALFSNVSTLDSVFKCMRFRWKRSAFSIVVVWKIGENASKSMRFQTKRISVKRALQFLVCNWRHRRHVGWPLTKYF